MAIKSKKIGNFNPLDYTHNEKFRLDEIPSDSIIEYKLVQFPPERRYYAKNQIIIYKLKIENLTALTRLDLKQVYIYEINKLILKELGLLNLEKIGD